MRIEFLAVGLLLLITGTALASSSGAVETRTVKNFVPVVPNGTIYNSTTISDVPLIKNDTFTISISGQNPSTSLFEVDLEITDPLGTSIVIPLIEAKGGVVANYTGNYKVRLYGVFMSPDRTFTFRIEKQVTQQLTSTPNSWLLPWGLALLVIGAGVTVFGAKTSKRKAPLRKDRKLKDRITNKRMLI